MHGLAVTLPGGLAENGSLQRQARFRRLTGKVEQALIDLNTDLDRPAFVTAVLAAALERIGDQPADSRRVDDLCVADRQYLMLRLAALIDGEQVWLKVNCGHCKALFDVDLSLDDLPVKPAGPSFPLATLRIEGRALVVRVPTGADQALIGTQSEREAMMMLLQSCIQSVDGQPPAREYIRALSQSAIEGIDSALDDVSPAVCNQLLVVCPECGNKQQADLDHYALTGLHKYFFYEEVHTLASHYHWSEAAILDLPQARRRLYIDMINRSAGLHAPGEVP